MKYSLIFCCKFLLASWASKHKNQSPDEKFSRHGERVSGNIELWMYVNIQHVFDEQKANFYILMG